MKFKQLGRILRMPEARHYKNEILNKGYVYTNVKSIEVKKETYNPNIIKSIFVKRKEIYKPLKLRSYYRHRVDFGDITSSFYEVLEDVFCEFFDIEKNSLEFYNKNKEKLKNKINIEGLENQDEIILNKELDTKFFDQLTESKITSEQTIKAHLSQEDLHHIFEHLIKVNLGGFAPKRSIPTFKYALWRWFKKYLNINYRLNNGAIYIENIILNNADIFSKLFDKAIREYKPIKEKENKKKMEELEEWNDEWEIEETRNYNPYIYKPFDYKLSLYVSPTNKKVYLNFDSTIEKEFVELLEQKEDKILWWWQNGNEHMKSNFGIKYGNFSTFQPDFLVMLKDGRLGIFDTKASGNREENNKLKAEALQRYIEEENKKGKNLFGGLIIKEGQHFRINSKKEYFSFREKPEDWEYLDFK